MTVKSTCTLNDARELLGVSEKTMRNYCKANKIPFFKERNPRGVLEYRFRREDLLFFLRQRTSGKATGNYSESVTPDIPENNMVELKENSILPEKKAEQQEKRYNSNPANAKSKNTGVDSLFQDKDFQVALLTQLKQENSFLKELLLEKEKQLAAKDAQLERCTEKISSLSETLAEITRQSLTRELP